ncbi:glycoside hydrolase family 97 catalytic domain-containing protein [Streptomyces sp. SBT349]|uniref:glycoside hydrolase family 97 catalytic domain-containing protein n=1 Tax=Streptomyces sp. SBT349 TaxID=1580539 RepID=UPI00066CDDEB|nr:glycoside hydrolase family 97 catalytic domain-containing protein [Streptomyces sp. SBT349]
MAGETCCHAGGTSPTTRLRVESTRVLLDVRSPGGSVVFERIELALRVGGVDLADGASLVRSTERVVRDTWRAHVGKAIGPHAYEHVEIVHELRAGSGQHWQVHVRQAPDGVAWRYALADLQGHASLDADLTTVPLDGLDRAWVLDYQTWYETPRVGADLPLAPSANGFGLPVLLRRGADPEQYVLITESAIDGRFSGAHLDIGADVARFVLADPAVEITRGIVTPWRVLVLGTLARVVETLLVDELAPAARPPLDAAGWTRPGRAAWSWWSDFYSGAQLDHQRRFVDGAAELGWEHLLIDCGWDATWVPDIVSYAARRGIQVHLWTVWHDLDGPEKLARLALWRSWGVAGIKVDFMESESKDRYRWYDTVLAETARLGLMVNFHGSVIPRGWARTWPHVVSYEAIRGAEYYVFYQGAPLSPAHNVIQPFTRNVLGSMDYTPVAFSAPERRTSDAHELALAVVYESGITHFADDVEVYRSRPEVARFLSELAPGWDRTLLLSGTPDTEAVLARRAGDRWFVGGIATGRGRTLTVPLARLGNGPWQAWIVTDAPSDPPSDPASDSGPARLVAETSVVSGHLRVDIANEGGFVAILAPADTELFRAAPRPTRPPVEVSPAVQILSDDGLAELRAEAGASLRLAPGWRAWPPEPTEPTRWRVQAPSTLLPGEVGVVTVERAGGDVPVVGHARIVAPLGAGVHTLSALGLTAFTNESGPAERDQSNGGGNPCDGQRMRVGGEEFDDGFGVSTPSRLTLHLGGRAARLDVRVGIDDETPGTSATARVLGDGAELAAVELTAGERAHELTVDLSGVDELVLRTEPPARGASADPAADAAADTSAYTAAHVDWAAGRIHGLGSATSGK